LAVDPPPDLVIEIDVTSPSRDRMGIYAAMEVPEVWVWREDRLQFWRLTGPGEYVKVDESKSLPRFPRELAEQLLAERSDHDETTLVRKFLDATRGL
jgi:Uma2 family endonuclease